MHKDVKEILYTQQQIAEKCQELATMINHDYHDKEVILVGLLKGSVPFLAELSKYIEIDVTFDYMDVSSYEGVEISYDYNQKRFGSGCQRKRYFTC